MRVLSIASLVSLVSSTAIPLTKRVDTLAVKLTATGNTNVKASVTNTGSVAVNLLSKGTFLDSAAVEKVSVFSEVGRIPFLGIRKRIKTTNLGEDAFTHVDAGQTIEVHVDLATVHDLSAGGTLKVSSFGALPYAEHGSTTLTDQVLHYTSNELEVIVNGTIAATVHRAIQPLDKRSVVQGDCTGSNRQNTFDALRSCSQLATAAASAATSGSASKFQEYFKTTDPSVRSVVAARLQAVSKECSSSNSGKTMLFCTDVYGACDSNTLAYTSPSDSVVVNCPIYFSYLPVLSSQCHAQDMSTTTLHEFTHATRVFSPGTEDYAYGYPASTSLSSDRATRNADSYALYANAIYVGC